MTPNELLAYLGPAFLYAGGATLAAVAGMRLAGVRIGGRRALTLFLALFFLALTQFPLPDRAALDCSEGGAEAILKPFTTLDHIARLWRWWRNEPEIGLKAWVGSKVIQAAVMNFALCAAIGAAFARHTRGPFPAGQAFLLGVALSGGAELAQLTGLFGLYPCAFRHFEVDDLILNIGGLMAGFLLMRRWRQA